MAHPRNQDVAHRWPELNPNNSGITPQMPGVVVMGVDAVGQLQQAAKPSSESQQYVLGHMRTLRILRGMHVRQAIGEVFGCEQCNGCD